jgi:hypothetical protein
MMVGTLSFKGNRMATVSIKNYRTPDYVATAVEAEGAFLSLTHKGTFHGLPHAYMRTTRGDRVSTVALLIDAEGIPAIQVSEREGQVHYLDPQEVVEVLSDMARNGFIKQVQGTDYGS